MAMAYALQNFRNYLLGGHFNIFIDHFSLKYLVNKPVLERKICCWLLLFQEFDFEIIVKLCHLSANPDNLSRIEIGEEPTKIEDRLPDA